MTTLEIKREVSDLPEGWSLAEMTVIDGAVCLVIRRDADGHTITADGRSDVPFSEVLATVIDETKNAPSIG